MNLRALTPLPIAVLAVEAFLLLVKPSASGQTVRTFDDGNNQFQQAAGAASVRGTTFNFLGGNDRLFLLRTDDSAGLGSGVANMADGRDVVFTDFNMSGSFNLGAGNDLFVSNGDVNFNGNAVDILVDAGPGNDIALVFTDFCRYAGAEGNDTFVSDGQRNTFDGGGGTDTYSAEVAPQRAIVNLATAQAFVQFNTPETISQMENVRGSDFNDEITGDSGNNRIDGLLGNDIIQAAGGNDTVSGGGGTNTLNGGPGTDTLVVEGLIQSRSLVNGILTVVGSLNGVSFVHNASAFEQVLDNGVLRTVLAFFGQVGTGTVQQTVIPETKPLPAVEGLVAGQTLNGDNNPNTINGGAGFDDIAGFGGNDVLRGLAGEDHIFGGTGADTVEGDDGHDVILGGPDNDTLRGGNQSDYIDGGTGDDFSTGGSGFDILDGGDGNDFLHGGPESDTLRGGNNNDSLDGAVGRDTLAGGANNDTFLFTAGFSGNDDVVADYNVAEDSIRIAASLVGLPVGPLPAARFKNTASGAVDADDRIIYDSTTGNLFFDSNGSAAGGSVLIADFASGLLMVAGEITLQ
jgi:serralysin